jgi:flagellar hook assembly protein FlgD
MKKILVSLLVLVLVFAWSTSFGAPFKPTLLRFSAPNRIAYAFDGKNLSIPLTITGTPATAIFCVYTKNKAESISKIKNGYLGWHYVNKIDTSLYVSGPVKFQTGKNTINWDGKGKDQTIVPAGEYTYYIFGYDGESQKVKANMQFRVGRPYGFFVEYDTKGLPVENPKLVDVTTRWTIGNDPDDKTLLETTRIVMPTGWASPSGTSVALAPDNMNTFFIETALPTSTLQAVWKYTWIPQGDAVRITDFGEDGQVSFHGVNNQEPGLASDGQYIIAGNNAQNQNNPESGLYIIDPSDGALLSSIDLSDWWVSPDAFKAGGQMNGGPNNIFGRGKYIWLNSHTSCLKQMVNPSAYLENKADLVVWSNGNGDNVLDHNFQPTAKLPWVCFDFNVGPYTYNVTSDANGFTVIPAYDMGAVSFGLLAPDGTGVNYFSYAGEAAAIKYGNQILDNGSAYDGLYTDNNSMGADAAAKLGTWFIGHDSIKGTISIDVGVKESAPSTFSVSQNSPNPFNPTTTINFSLVKAGKVTVEIFNSAGQKVDTLVNTTMNAGPHSVVWNAARLSGGVYFYTVKSGETSRTMKMTLMK